MSKKEEKKFEQEDFEKINCGYIAPISEIAGLNSGYWSKLKDIIQEVINELNEELKKNKQKLNFRMVSDNEASDIIQESIVKSLYHDKVVICNISYRNPNVLFELGMRIAFNKSVIMIFDNIEKCPFDVSGIRYITYDKNLDYYDILEFKKNLKIKIKDTLTTKEEGNPFLRVLKDEILFKVTPEEREISENDKILLDIIQKIEKDISLLRIEMGKEQKENYYRKFNFDKSLRDSSDSVFFKLLDNNEELQNLLELDLDEFLFVKKAFQILEKDINLTKIFSPNELKEKLRNYFYVKNPLHSYIKFFK